MVDEIHRLGQDLMISQIYKEDISYDELKQEYLKFLSTSNSEYYSWMYLIDGKFGVVLDAHIYLYTFNDKVKEAQKNILPWIYPESKRYLGDTWWSEDEEILNDLKKLSIIEFLDKYKGY